MKISNVTWFWYDIENEIKLAYLVGGFNLIATAPKFIVLYANNLIYIVLAETKLWFSIGQSWQSNIKTVPKSPVYRSHYTMYYVVNSLVYKKQWNGKDRSENWFKMGQPRTKSNPRLGWAL